MAVTYTTIASITLTSFTNNIFFSGIPQTYTDLRLRFTMWDQSGGGANLIIRMNGLSGSQYGQQTFSAYGSNQKLTTLFNNNSSWRLGVRQTIPTNFDQAMHGWVDYFGYAGSTNKSGFWYTQISNSTLERSVGTVRTTSGITSMMLLTSNGNDFGAGSRATLYGILRS